MIIPRIATVTALVETFSNWPSCILRSGLAFYLHYFPKAIEWKTRRGTVIKSPAGDQSWWAVLETFALDSYGLRKGTLGDEESPYFVDIGGNIGAFSLALLEAHPNARGIAVEPGNLAFAFLTANLRANQATESVKSIKAAIVGRANVKTLQFFEKPTATGGSTAVDECTRSESEPGSWVEVPAMSIQELLAQAEREVSLVKMDIEGGEYDIILNASPEAWQRVRRIVAEYHPVEGHSYQQLVERLSLAGFQLERHEAYKNDGFGALLFARRNAI